MSGKFSVLDFGSTLRSEHKLCPMPLYKYVSFHTLLHLVSGNIRYTQPGALNDSFEMIPESPAHPKRSVFELNLTFSMTAEPSLGSEHNVELVGEYDDMIFRTIRPDLDNSVGMVCLTRTSRSTAMWAYYAEQYMGAVVEFDESNVAMQGAIEVRYRGERPRIDALNRAKEIIPLADLCVKAMDWAHERESRIFAKLDDCKRCGRDERGFDIFVMELPTGCITSVIVGERMPTARLRVIWNELKCTDIAMHMDVVDISGFKFRRAPLKLKGISSPLISVRSARIWATEPGTVGDLART